MVVIDWSRRPQYPSRTTTTPSSADFFLQYYPSFGPIEL